MNEFLVLLILGLMGLLLVVEMAVSHWLTESEARTYPERDVRGWLDDDGWA